MTNKQIAASSACSLPPSKRTASLKILQSQAWQSWLSWWSDRDDHENYCVNNDKYDSLRRLFRDAGSLTVFAPTNEAMERLDEETRAKVFLQYQISALQWIMKFLFFLFLVTKDLKDKTLLLSLSLSFKTLKLFSWRGVLVESPSFGHTY